MASRLLSRRGFIGKGLMASALAATIPALATAAVHGSANGTPPLPEEEKDKLPTLLLISSAHQFALEAQVKAILRGKVNVVTPKENCGNTLDIMRKMPEWIKSYNPEIVHICTGFEDMRSMYYGTYEPLIPKSLYKRNTQQIIDFVFALSDKAVPIWATMTPVNDDWIEAHKSKVRDWTFFSDDVEVFNKEALRVCNKLNVKVNDLNTVLTKSGPDSFLERNGYELNTKGIAVVAQNIAFHAESLI